MKAEVLKRNIRLLSQLLRSIVGERFKQLAREEKLSKFSNQVIDPVLHLDLSLQMEREAIHLAEISLLELVTSERLSSELRRSALRVQEAHQSILAPDEDDEFLKSENLVRARMKALQCRVQFYKAFLTVEESSVNTPLTLALKAFISKERFSKKLDPVLSADRDYFEELARAAPQIQRFLVKKQADIETQKSENLWREFENEVFRQPQALP
ncbi:MAG: hypothetical protein EA369_01835 [Bradymonadales bacterium]|nr:MAG: hypothetical protein EA369_01835 [Bradymonadales bacterium]